MSSARLPLQKSSTLFLPTHLCSLRLYLGVVEKHCESKRRASNLFVLHRHCPSMCLSDAPSTLAQRSAHEHRGHLRDSAQEHCGCIHPSVHNNLPNFRSDHIVGRLACGCAAAEFAGGADNGPTWSTTATKTHLQQSDSGVHPACFCQHVFQGSGWNVIAGLTFCESVLPQPRGEVLVFVNRPPSENLPQCCPPSAHCNVRINHTLMEFNLWNSYQFFASTNRRQRSHCPHLWRPLWEATDPTQLAKLWINSSAARAPRCHCVVW